MVGFLVEFTHVNFAAELLEAFLGHLVVALDHVVGLLGVEGVGDGAEDEDVELDPCLPLLLLLALFFLQCTSVQGGVTTATLEIPVERKAACSVSSAFLASCPKPLVLSCKDEEMRKI